jgi:hypothetical protein
MLLSVAAVSQASVTVGQNCASNSSGPVANFTTSVSSGASYQFPTSGIVTNWGTDRTASSNYGAVALLTGRLSSGVVTVTSMSPYEFAAIGSNPTYPARFPVSAGDYLGSTTLNSEPRMCNTGNPQDLGNFGSADAVGETVPGPSTPGYRNAIWAQLEADADSDGYGDDTQDKCPQSAAFQNACPVLAISQQLSSSSKQIKVLATASVNTSLTATATAKISSKKTVTFKSKATAFSAGQLKTVKLSLPSSVKNALAALKKSKKLKVTVTLSGNGLANTATSVKSISLPGTKK